MTENITFLPLRWRVVTIDSSRYFPVWNNKLSQINFLLGSQDYDYIEGQSVSKTGTVPGVLYVTVLFITTYIQHYVTISLLQIKKS